MRRWATVVACGLLWLLLSCDRDDPTFELTSGSIEVSSTPSGAAVCLDGSPVGLETPATLERVPQGVHWIRVELPGFEADEDSLVVEVQPGRTTPAEFRLTEIPGSLAVDSTPGGGTILLDGGDTGYETPATLTGLALGEHVVRVELAGHLADPESLLVTILSDQTAYADFVLTPLALPATKIVLLESFSNVCCDGCPEMSALVDQLMHAEGYGPDRVLLVKFSLNYPLATDPHYLANPADNDARALGPNYDLTGYYADLLMGGIPTLLGDGGLLGASGKPPLELTALTDLVEGLLDADPGFSLQPTATIEGTTVNATVELRAERALDLEGCTLRVALVENPIEYGDPPCAGSEELAFHWVMRDLASAGPAPSDLDAGASVTKTLSLTRTLSWPAERLSLIAFVQRDATREILQAGSNVAFEKATGSPGAFEEVSPSLPALPRGRQP